MPGKNAALIRQIDARRIDQINDRHAVTHRDLLRPQYLLDRFRVPGSGLDRRVVRHHDAFAAVDLADDRNDRRRRSLAVVFVICDEQADLLAKMYRRRAAGRSLAGRQLSLCVDLFDLFRARRRVSACAQGGGIHR